jgi:hypothetical protein
MAWCTCMYPSLSAARTLVLHCSTSTLLPLPHAAQVLYCHCHMQHKYFTATATCSTSPLLPLPHVYRSCRERLNAHNLARQERRRQEAQLAAAAAAAALSYDSVRTAARCINYTAMLLQDSDSDADNQCGSLSATRQRATRARRTGMTRVSGENQQQLQQVLDAVAPPVPPCTPSPASMQPMAASTSALSSTEQVMLLGGHDVLPGVDQVCLPTCHHPSCAAVAAAAAAAAAVAAATAAQDAASTAGAPAQAAASHTHRAAGTATPTSGSPRGASMASRLPTLADASSHWTAEAPSWSDAATRWSAAPQLPQACWLSPPMTGWPATWAYKLLKPSSPPSPRVVQGPGRSVPTGCRCAPLAPATPQPSPHVGPPMWAADWSQPLLPCTAAAASCDTSRSSGSGGGSNSMPTSASMPHAGSQPLLAPAIPAGGLTTFLPWAGVPEGSGRDWHEPAAADTCHHPGPPLSYTAAPAAPAPPRGELLGSLPCLEELLHWAEAEEGGESPTTAFENAVGGTCIVGASLNIGDGDDSGGGGPGPLQLLLPHDA